MIGSEYVFETFEHAGIPVEIVQDTDAGDPFEQFEQLAEIVWTDREHASSREQFRDPDYFRDVAHMQRYLTLMDGYLVAVPFRLVDYGSGGNRATLYRDAYPERVSGFLVVSEAQREKVGASREGLEENALHDWNQWRAWVEGDVYGYVVASGAEDSESVFGFYGDLEYVRKEARETAEDVAAERARLRALPWLPTFGNPIMRTPLERYPVT